MSRRQRLAATAAACLVVLTVGAHLADAQECDPVSHPCPNTVFLPLTRNDPPNPTPTPFPTEGDVTIEQSRILTDYYGGTMIVGMYRNNVQRWMHYLGVDIDIEMRDAHGVPIGTASGWVTLMASGWGVSSCYYTHLAESEGHAKSIEVVASARSGSSDIGPRHHLDSFGVRVVPESGGKRYRVEGTLVNNHSFALDDTELAAVSVFDGSGRVVGCTSIRVPKLQPGESVDFETDSLRQMRGPGATSAMVQAFLTPAD